MPYFPDLSTYVQWPTSDLDVVESHWPDPDVTALNVGWLSGHEPYPTGPAPPGLVKRLVAAARRPQNLTRGRHVCDLCAEPRRVIVMRSGVWRVGLGNGEIHVPGRDGIVYVAPTMVAHYVADHEYLPPAEFVDAVLGR